MTDPFSIVSGACGVFSTGITVCGGIISYCSALKGADEEVDRIVRKAARMQNTMHLLENTLKDNSSLIERDHADTLHKMVEAIEAGTDVLQDEVKKCWGELQVQPGKQVQIISKNAAKKALYPFRRSSLVSLSSVLDSLQLELNTAMLMAQMQSYRHSHTTILSQSSATYTKVEEGFASLEARLDSGLSVQLGRQLSSSDPLSSPPEDSLRQISSSRYHRIARKDRTTKSWLLISRRMFGYNVSASFEVSMGSQGLKLAPSLSFRAVVPYHSPAFKLVGRIGRLDLNIEPERMPGLVDDTIVQLRQLYTDGKASPSDIDPAGRSILHEICALYWKFSQSPGAFPNYVQLINLCLEHASHEAEWLGRTPIDYFLGTARVEGSKFFAEWNFSDYDLTPQYQTILRSLLQRGAGTSKGASVIARHPKKKQLVSMIGNGLDISDVHSAILHESKPDLELAIPLCQDESKLLPLRVLATSWPDGLEIFLERGSGLYRKPDLHSALSEAILHNQPFSVQLLFNSKLRFPLHILGLSYRFDERMCEILVAQLAKQRSELRKLAINALPNEELERLGVSTNELPDTNSNSIYAALMERGVAVPDELRPLYLLSSYDGHEFEPSGMSVFERSCCLKLMKHLHRAGFRSKCRSLCPPRSFMPLANLLDRHFWLIDMGLNFSPSGDTNDLSTAQELWAIIIDGFVTVVEPEFLLEIPKTCEQVCQKISMIYENLNARQKALWKDSLASNEIDDCFCACSSDQGCRSITIALNDLFTMRSWYHKKGNRIIGHHTCFRSRVIECLFRDQSENSGFVLAVLRFLTFNELGLTHTCRSSHYRTLRWGASAWSRDDVERLQEEEKPLLEQLDVLVSEFQQKYMELGIPLYDFIYSYWADSMKEVLFKRERADAQVIQGARQIGVWLDWEPVDEVELALDKPCQFAPTVLQAHSTR